MCVCFVQVEKAENREKEKVCETMTGRQRHIGSDGQGETADL